MLLLRKLNVATNFAEGSKAMLMQNHFPHEIHSSLPQVNISTFPTFEKMGKQNFYTCKMLYLLNERRKGLDIS